MKQRGWIYEKNSSNSSWCAPRKEKSETKKTSGTDKLERHSSHRRCVNCEETRIDLKLLPCSDCGAYMHFPSCSFSNGTAQGDADKPICRNCEVIDQDEAMESDFLSENLVAAPQGVYRTPEVEKNTRYVCS